MKTPLPPEFDAMAQRFMQLWQEHWLSLANSREAASAMQRLTELMVPPSNLNSFTSTSPGDENDSAAPFKQAAATGTKAAASALDALSHQLAQLAARVDALGERLDARPATPDKPAPAKRRTAKPRAKPAPASGKKRTESARKPADKSRRKAR